MVRDADEINRLLKPDVVILDEAQRIKNWQTKTARRVKSLIAPYAFVLTGTPLENRIDETYSIVQYLDPEVSWAAVPLQPRLLHARRARASGRLQEPRRDAPASSPASCCGGESATSKTSCPGRTDQTFFVPMKPEQAERYADYEFRARNIAAIAQHRPLTKEEFERLQQYLACMRMVCDTPAILDPECRVSPKLEELEGVLAELLEDASRKIIVFSEWVKMLELVRELAAEMGVDAAWHTGGVPQLKRRAEIQRFREDSTCRLFLTSDSGATGLNLQMANAVINMDLPWNPAKLEQRIARAWRKDQKRWSPWSISSPRIPSNTRYCICSLTNGRSPTACSTAPAIFPREMPSGRAALIERMQALILPHARLPAFCRPRRLLSPKMSRRHGENLLLIEARKDDQTPLILLVVLDLDATALAAEKTNPQPAPGRPERRIHR